MSFRPPPPEALQIPGPAGTLEAIADVPANAGGERFAVLCHPHPQQGGAMTNKVIHTVARAFNELGVPTLRFNFRGVGKSTGSFDEGRGETDDALAAIAWGRQRWPAAKLWLGGFSFGGVIALRAAQTTAPSLLVTVAPAVTRLGIADIKVPDCPWLLVQGAVDDVVATQSVVDWVATLAPAPALKLIPEAGHFFHGKLHEVRDAVVGFANDHGHAIPLA